MSLSCYHQSSLSECLSPDILLSVRSFYFITFIVKDIILFSHNCHLKFTYLPSRPTQTTR